LLADELIVDAKEIGRVGRNCYGRRLIHPLRRRYTAHSSAQRGLTHRGDILFVARPVPK
jgi:hypothetical protein